ncbi:keratin, type I cytoskeletal 47 kDa-like [Ambystoma mexicanum]|uniref:keratin, type I cytoskeletal 47 kDa-like n=1 Tax=Ambystoma mexicanum TaxID=8296 RepID=UPI0037E97C2F
MSFRSFKGASSSGFAVKQGGGGGGYGGGGHGHGGGGGYGVGGHGGGVQAGGSFNGGSFGRFSGGSAAGDGMPAWVQGGGFEGGAFGVHDSGFAVGAGGGFGAEGGFGGGFGGGHGGGFGGGHGGGAGGDNLLTGSEKETMQNLNDRLATYMDNVNALENANAELERKIREWYDKHKPGGSTGEAAQDYSKYYQQIADLQAKIIAAEIANASVILMVDNASLACDDFKLKYENEQKLRQSLEADINGLRRVHDDLTLCNSDLETQAESLREELAALKKNHEEEIKGHQSVADGELSVEMRAAPAINLLDAMNKMRQEYEALAEKNRQEAEEEFKQKSEKLKQDISTGVEQVHSSKSESSDLKRSLQALQIELQSQLSMKSSLEQQLAETEGRYCQQLVALQSQISAVEEQLTDMRSQSEHQSDEYNQLLDIKSRLEQEIATYQHLLDGQDGGSGSSSGRAGGSSSGGYGSSSGAGSASHRTSSSSTTKGNLKYREQMQFPIGSIALSHSYNSETRYRSIQGNMNTKIDKEQQEKCKTKGGT